MNDSEAYYLRILQLYFPWRKERDLKNEIQTYEEKYHDVENHILSNLRKHEPNIEIDYEELSNNFINTNKYNIRTTKYCK